MKYLTEEKLKDFRNKFGDLFHYPNMAQWIENEIDFAVSEAQQQVKVEPEVKVNFAEVNEVIDELIEKNLNKERWQMRPDNWREFVGYEKALKELKTILSKISA